MQAAIILEWLLTHGIMEVASISSGDTGHVNGRLSGFPGSP
jgi:hypothetical protein